MKTPLKKRGASSATVIGSLIVGLLIGAGVVYVAAPSIGLSSTNTITKTATGAGSGTVTTTVTGPSGATVTSTITSTVNSGGSGLCNGGTITLGLLNDLSGGLSAQGQGDLAAEQLAIQDVNTYLTSAGCSLQFAANSQDYKLDTPTALSQLTAFHAAGIQVVIGPLNSGTAAGILSYADSNHIVLISPSSTSAALNIPNDYLFRTAPNDAAQGQADARELIQAGAKAVIVVNRDDTYGDGLANATIASLKQDDPSIIIGGPTKYDVATTDFSSVITAMGSEWTQLSSQVGAANVAIYAVSFQELGTLVQQANTQNAALLNTTIPWFGSDGEAQNSLLSNSTVGQYTSQVGLYSTLFNVVNNSKTLDFFQAHKGTPQLAAITGGGVFYTLEGYDDVWLAALSILSAGANNGASVQAILPTVAANFYGLTGWEGLQPSGDRIPGSYNVWKVVGSGGTYSWILAGTWDFNTDEVTWLPGQAPA